MLTVCLHTSCTRCNVPHACTHLHTHLHTHDPHACTHLHAHPKRTCANAQIHTHACTDTHRGTQQLQLRPHLRMLCCLLSLPRLLLGLQLHLYTHACCWACNTTYTHTHAAGPATPPIHTPAHAVQPAEPPTPAAGPATPEDGSTHALAHGE
jgi:hypothetical protein